MTTNTDTDDRSGLADDPVWLHGAARYGQLTNSEIGRHLGLPASTVTKKLRDAHVVRVDNLGRPDLHAPWVHFAWVATRSVELIAGASGRTPFSVAHALQFHHGCATPSELAHIYLADGQWAKLWHPKLVATSVDTHLQCSPEEAQRYVQEHSDPTARPLNDADVLELPTNNRHVTSSQIGLMSGTSRTNVSRIFREHGVSRTADRSLQFRLLDEHAELLRTMYAEFTQSEVGRMTGIAKSRLPASGRLERHIVHSQQVAEIAARIESGSSIYREARRVGISSEGMKARLLRDGHDIPSYPGPKDYSSFDGRHIYQQLYVQNVPAKDVAAQLNVPAGRLSFHAEQVGVPHARNRFDQEQLLFSDVWLRRQAAQSSGVRQIARRLGCRWHLVRNRLANAQIAFPEHVAADVLNDPEWLHCQVVEKRRSLLCVADELDVSEYDVTCALDRCNISRPKAQVSRHHLLNDTAWMSQQSGVSAVAIALRADIVTVKRAQHELSSAIRPDDLDDVATLRRLAKNNLTVQDIARRSGLRAEHVIDRYERHGLAAPPLRRRARPHDVVANLDAAWLEQQYVTERRSANEIANELGVDRRTVADVLASNGVTLRQNEPSERTVEPSSSPSDRRRPKRTAVSVAADIAELDGNVRQLSPKQREWLRHVAAREGMDVGKYGHLILRSAPLWLEHKYVDEGMSQTQIAAMLNVTRPGVQHALRRFGISR